MKRIDVAAGLVFHEGLLLITQRPADKHLGGLWEFPGGKREPDETFEHCLRRELMEELGIEVEVGAEVEEMAHDYSDKKVLLKFFLCSLVSGSVTAHGCEKFAWVTHAQLDQFEFPAADARLLNKLREHFDSWAKGGKRQKKGKRRQKND